MTPTPPTSDPCLDLIVEIELAIDGRNPADRASFIHDAIARHPSCAEAIRSHFLMAALNRQPVVPTGHQFRKDDEVGGRYRVERFVARGGMGEVYEATDLLLDRTVAFKVIRPQAVGTTSRDRFHREGVVLADVHHTNVVPIHDTGEDQGVRFHALQFVRGITLHRALEAIRQDVLGPQSSGGISGLVRPLLDADTAPLPPTAPPPRRRFGPAHFTSAAEVLAQAADGLHHTHSRGYCHRDVKPSNMMLDTDGVCWLIDFGLAGFTETGQVVGGGEAGSGVTHGPLGTPEYMAPEQFDARADARTDVWGLGVTLYEFLTLRRPFAGATFADLERQVRNAPPIPPRRVVREVPAALEAICLKALEKDPARRYQTTSAMADDLRRWLTWRPTGVRPGWLTLRPLRLWAWRHQGLSLALVLMLALAGLIWGWTYQRGEQQLAEASAQADRQRNEVAFLKVQEEVTAFRQLGRGHVGWSDELTRLLDKMQALQPEARLRDLRATALIGLDCRLESSYMVPQQNGQRRGFGDVAFSPSGKGIAVGGTRLPQLPLADHTPAMAWADGLGGVPVVAAEVGNGPVAFLDEHTPLQLIGPTLDRHSLVIWNLATNRKAAEIATSLTPEVALALARDGRAFAASAPDGAAGTTVWALDPDSATPVRPLAHWDVAASALAFSADGRYLAVGTPAGEVTVHSLYDRHPPVSFPSVRLVVSSLAFGRRYLNTGLPPAAPTGIPGLQLAVGTMSGKLLVYDLETLTPTTVVHDFSSFLNALAFSPDGATLAVAGHRAPVLVNVATGRVRFQFFGKGNTYHGSQVYTGVAFSPDGRRIAFSGFAQYGQGHGGVDVFTLDDDRGVSTYHGLSGWVQKVWMSKSTKWVAALSHQWQAGVWERETGRLAHVWEVPAGAWADNAYIAFDHTEESVFVAGGRHITRYRLSTGERLDNWQVEDGLNDTLIMRPDGQVWSFRRDIRRPDPASLFALRQTTAEGVAAGVWAVHWPPRTEMVLRHLTAGGARVVYRRQRPPGELHRLELSADGREVDFVLTVGGQAQVVRWDVASGEVRERTTKPPRGWVALPVYSMSEPSGLQLIEAGHTEPTLLFDLGNEPLGHAHEMVSPDGRLVHWGRRDGTVLVADIHRCRKALEKYPR